MKRKIALLLTLAMLMSLSLFGCGTPDKTPGNTPGETDDTTEKESAAPEETTPASEGNKQLVAELGPNPETIDPALNSAVDGGNMLLFAFDCLLNIDKDNKVIPGAAESFKTSEDGLTWTFKLRSGLKWSDGRPYRRGLCLQLEACGGSRHRRPLCPDRSGYGRGL